MNEIEQAQCELRELHQAVAEVQSVMAESWFREMAGTDVGDHLAMLTSVLERTLGGA